MGDGVTTVRDDVGAYADGTVASIRVLSVPESARFPEGHKYAFHYGEAGAEHPVVRFDNHHGPHELHIGATTYEIEFPGLRPLTGPGGPRSHRRSAPTGDVGFDAVTRPYTRPPEP